MKVKYSKLTSKQIDRLLDTFCLGIPALQASIFAWVHRNTAQKFFTKIRIHIAEESSKHISKLQWEIEIDESYIGWRRKWNRWRWAWGKHIVFGILERWWRVRVIPVGDVSAQTLMTEIENNTEKWCVYYTDHFKSYNSLSRFWKHLTVDHQAHFANGRSHINGIEWFWSYAKRFLSKYNGVSKKNFILYLKEIEFRFNNRHIKKLKPLIKKFI